MKIYKGRELLSAVEKYMCLGGITAKFCIIGSVCNAWFWVVSGFNLIQTPLCVPQNLIRMWLIVSRIRGSVEKCMGVCRHGTWKSRDDTQRWHESNLYCFKYWVETGRTKQFKRLSEKPSRSPRDDNPPIRSARRNTAICIPSRGSSETALLSPVR